MDNQSSFIFAPHLTSVCFCTTWQTGDKEIASSHSNAACYFNFATKHTNTEIITQPSFNHPSFKWRSKVWPNKTNREPIYYYRLQRIV